MNAMCYGGVPHDSVNPYLILHKNTDSRWPGLSQLHDVPLLGLRAGSPI